MKLWGTRLSTAPSFSMWIGGTLALALAFIVAPALWFSARFIEKAILNEQVRVLERRQNDWAARLNDRLLETAGSAARMGRLLTERLDRDPAAAPADFDALVEQRPDGAWVTRKEGFNRENDAVIWLPKGYPLDAEEKIFLLESKRLMELYRSGTAADPIDNWIIPLRNGLVMYWPTFANYIDQVDTTIDFASSEWVTLAAPQNNPAGEPRWTPTSYDPAAREWMVSAVAPFFRNGAFAGSVGHDLTVNTVGRSLAELSVYLGSEHTLTRDDGTLLVSSREQEKIHASQGTLKIGALADNELARAFEEAKQKNPEALLTWSRAEGERVFVAAHMPSTGWYLLTGVPKASLMAAVEGSYRGYWLGAALAILVMVALPVLVIMRVTVPSVRQMVLAAERIRQGDLEQRFQASGTRELVQIGEALDAMVAQIQSSVEERSKALAALEESEKVARSMLAQKELDEAELKKRYEVIETQQLAIRAMSTPIIRVWNEVLALPVVGLLDRERATEIMEKLLAAIAQQRARVAIVDLTGVESVDEATAEHLVKLMQSVRLLGARGIVTGLRPEVARRLVATGVELQGVETLATLHEAIRMCLQGPAGQAPGRPGRRSS